MRSHPVRWATIALAAPGLVLSLGGAAMGETGQPPERSSGVYVSMGGLLAGLRRAGVRCPSGSQGATIRSKLGYGATAAAGYEFQGGLRLEAEVALRSNGASALVLSPASAPLSGDVTSLALMGNAYYDIKALSVGPLVPYLGAGVGLARVDASDLKSGSTLLADAGSDRLAYQGIAGVNVALSRAWSANLDYRYFATLDPSFRTPGGRVTTHYRTDNFSVGMTYHFAP